MLAAHILSTLQKIAPLSLAASWDNVGLLVGSEEKDVRRVMSCVTLTEAVFEEACLGEVDMILTHHPLPFRGVKKLCDDHPEGRLLRQICSSDMVVYSAHTAWDQAPGGGQDLLLEKLVPQANPHSYKSLCTPEDQRSGAGRYAELNGDATIAHLLELSRQHFSSVALSWVAGNGRSQASPITKVAAACGVGSSLVAAALEVSCDVFITGELRYHELLALQAAATTVLLLGHFASERKGMERLNQRLSDELPQITASLSQRDICPLQEIPPLSSAAGP